MNANGKVGANPHRVTLRIEKTIENGTATIRLIGRARSEHLDALGAEVQTCASRVVTIDLAEITNLDVEAVHFLSACELRGFYLINCPPFVREWIQRERETEES